MDTHTNGFRQLSTVQYNTNIVLNSRLDAFSVANADGINLDANADQDAIVLPSDDEGAIVIPSDDAGVASMMALVEVLPIDLIIKKTCVGCSSCCTDEWLCTSTKKQSKHAFWIRSPKVDGRGGRWVSCRVKHLRAELIKWCFLKHTFSRCFSIAFISNFLV